MRIERGQPFSDQGWTRGELSTRSELFRTLWAAHDVRLHRTGSKRLNHPLVGEIELSYEAMELPADPGLTIHVYSTEPASPSADALNLLASWAATLDQVTPEPEVERQET